MLKQAVIGFCLLFFSIDRISGEVPPTFHPAINVTNILKNFYPVNMGMHFLSEDSLIVVTGKIDKSPKRVDNESSVYLITSPRSQDPRLKKIDSGYVSLYGVTSNEGVIYVSGKRGLYSLRKWVHGWKKELITEWPGALTYHYFSFCPIFYNGKIHVVISGDLKDPTGPDRGAWAEVDPETGETTILARGLRTPNGMGHDGNGGFFVTDNEGEWLPTSKFIHLQSNKHFGYQSEIFDPPTAWLPHRKVSRSPTQPVRLVEAPYSGDWLYADANEEGMFRIHLDTVNDQLQGGVFPFSGGFGKKAINRMIQGPDGAYYLGSVGTHGNWPRESRIPTMKMEFKPNDFFDFIAVKSKINGLELFFNQKVTPEQLDEAEISVKQWRYIPSKSYGGKPKEVKDLQIFGKQIAPDSMSVFLHLDGMIESHVIEIILPENFSSAKDQTIWNRYCWFTQNYFSNEVPFSIRLKPVSVNPSVPGTLPRIVSIGGNQIHLTLAAKRKFTLSLYDMNGTRILKVLGVGAQKIKIPQLSRSGILFAKLALEGESHTFPVISKIDGMP